MTVGNVVTVRSFDICARTLTALEHASMLLAGACFVAVAVITGCDVAMRYVFDAPFDWSYVLISQYLMVVMLFLALGATQRVGQNIGVDILTRRLPERLRAALAAICLLLMVGYVWLIVQSGWGVFADAWSSGDVLAGAIPWPRWPALLLVPLGCFLLLFRLLLEFAGNLAAGFGVLELASHRRTRPSHASLIE